MSAEEQDRDDLIEVREEVAEEEQRVMMNTGQSFGDIGPKQSTNRESVTYQGETFQGGQIAEEMLEK